MHVIRVYTVQKLGNVGTVIVPATRRRTRVLIQEPSFLEEGAWFKEFMDELKVKDGSGWPCQVHHVTDESANHPSCN
jgi:hypothetical protein